jgi:hypothetical protein
VTILRKKSSPPASPALDQSQQGSSPLLDHLVGAGEQRRWHFEAEHGCGLQVDDKLEFGRLQDRLSSPAWRP